MQRFVLIFDGFGEVLKILCKMRCVCSFSIVSVIVIVSQLNSINCLQDAVTLYCNETKPCTIVNSRCDSFWELCICIDGFTFIDSNTRCIEMPKLSENCILSNQTVECNGYGVNVSCNSEPGPDHGKCVCKASYAPNIAAKECSPIAKKLNEQCNSDRECFIAYSFCSQNKCKCLPGFSPDAQGHCTSTEGLRCPPFTENNILVQAAAGRQCSMEFNLDTLQQIHTCNNDTEFCFMHPKTKTVDGKFHGHCCPKPAQGVVGRTVCPLGGLLSNGTCPDTSDLPMDVTVPTEFVRTCPYSTHECVRNPTKKEEVCCPTPCIGSSSHFNIDGKCYDYVLIGEPCIHNAQCIGHAKCTASGAVGRSICSCPAGTKAQSQTDCSTI